MALLIFYVLLALSISFLCSIMEAVLLSITPSYMALIEQQDHSLARRLRTLKDNIDRPLAAILSLNTIAHTVGATGAGAQATALFGNAYIGVISGILTLLILIVSEIIPKTLGAVYWKVLTPGVVRLLQPLIWLLWPLVKLSQALTGLLSRNQDVASVSRAEMSALAELGTKEGVLEEGESRILKNLFRFHALRVRDIMTPRTVLFLLHEDTTVKKVLDNHSELGFSRIPLYRANRDDITGVILKDDLLLKAAQGEFDLPLRTIRRDLIAVPHMLPLPDLFERMLENSEHIALVVDEYGGTEGLVTMEDIVETLLGMEIVDEADSARDMQVLARQQWLLRARRLGIVPDESQDYERDVIIRLGLTGKLTKKGGAHESGTEGNGKTGGTRT